MKDLIKYIVQSLVDNPDKVVVDEVVAQQTLVLELKVAKEDLGKVVGKHGRNAQAIRTVLSCVSEKLKKKVFLDIVE